MSEATARESDGHAAAGRASRGAGRAQRTVLVAGNPNSGKTTLFNLLTGARGKVGNYPGVTVDRRSARLALPTLGDVDLVDLPGTYSLTARSAEEKVAADTLLGPLEAAATAPVSLPDAVVLVVDATALRRGLYFATQILDTGTPLVLCLNMMDEAREAGISIDVEKIAPRLGCDVVPIVAKTGEGKEALLAAVERALGRAHDASEAEELPSPLAEDVAAVEDALAALSPGRSARERRTLATWAMLSLGDDEIEGVPERLRAVVAERRARAAGEGRDLDEAIVAQRYRRIDALLAGSHARPAQPKKRLRDRFDSILMHPVLGFVVFALVMAGVFEALFSWSEPAVGAVESLVALTKDSLGAALPEGAFRDLCVDGIVAGVGNVLVFVPQIALLFVFITFLEDSGYLARVAFVIDRVMGGVGLNGRAFVPMLSGFACAIPAVMATRTIESRRDRLLTMLVIPLSSCSARLPVYVLVTATVFSPQSRVLGVFSTGAVVLFSMYALSITAAIGAAYVLRRTALKGPKPALVLELPPYRMPQLRNILVSTWQRVRRFVVDAGTVILALTIVLWALLTYPKDATVEADYARQKDQVAHVVDAEQRSVELEKIEREHRGALLRHSAGGRLGAAIEPALEPLGFDWRIGIGILGAFAAREVFVSTLGVVFNIGDADEKTEPLREALRGATRADGTHLFTPLVGVALMVFFVLACQCMSTLAVVRRESGSWRWPGLLFVYMSLLAYGVTLLVYQIGHALGWGVS